MIISCVFMGMMGIPKIPAPPPQPHLYSQELQLKLYQAFIFSIPILFSIILILLFYLFYLKRRASSPVSTSSPTVISQSLHGAAFIDSSNNGIGGLKELMKLKLPVILYEDNSRDIETPCCCVCLGEYMVKEEVHKLPACNHIFHIDCIRLWLHSNSTCPLCRCSVLAIIPTTTDDIIIQQNVMLPNTNTNTPATDDIIIQQNVMLPNTNTNTPVAAVAAAIATQ